MEDSFRGAVELKGKAMNKVNMKVVASAVEMVQAGNAVVRNKTGGIIKQMSDEQMAQLEELLKKLAGCATPIGLRDDQFTVATDVDVDVCAEEEAPPTPEAGEWENPSREIKARTSKNSCGFGCECDLKIGLGDVQYHSPLTSGSKRQEHPSV